MEGKQRGRPVKGNAMSAAEKQAAYRERQRAKEGRMFELSTLELSTIRHALQKELCEMTRLKLNTIVESYEKLIKKLEVKF